MSITIDKHELLAQFGQNGEHWIQGIWSNGERLCLHEGIKRCTAKQLGDFHIIEQVAKAEGWGPTWNDAEDREWSDVEAKILEGIEITPDRLEAVFGPQWSDAVGFVREAASLADQQARYAPRYAPRYSAWYAARDAAWDAARDAAWDAARHAAHDAAWYAARHAAHDAAGAIVVRDLIGEHGFTQDHYDSLVQPWECVMGTLWTRGES